MENYLAKNVEMKRKQGFRVAVKGLKLSCHSGMYIYIYGTSYGSPNIVTYILSFLNCHPG